MFEMRFRSFCQSSHLGIIIPRSHVIVNTILQKYFTKFPLAFGIDFTKSLDYVILFFDVRQN